MPKHEALILLFFIGGLHQEIESEGFDQIVLNIYRQVNG
jgi:hypothetical protein